MNTEVILHGTLKPDGTLELEGKPNLSPGPVLVRIQPTTAGNPARRGLAEVIEEIRQSQRGRGFQGLTPEEMQAEEAPRQADDEDYEQRMQTLWSQTRTEPPRRN